MAFDIHTWTQRFLHTILHAFGESRVVCIGLQGSYARGEATADSDIDVVVILDDVSIGDLDTYRDALDGLPVRERSCGFLAGKRELCRWDPADLLLLYYDTRPLHGTLDFLQPLFGREDAVRALHTGACALYHACCHSYLHGSGDALPGLCKSAFFLLRLKYYCEAGRYVLQRQALAECLAEHDLRILQLTPDGSEADRRRCTDRLLIWCAGLIADGPLQ